MSLADAELVARSRRHDAAAFGTLVERHQRLVFGVALARCRDPMLAEDVAQEAFVTAWRELDRLRDERRVGPWVAGIARNLAANAARERARHANVTLPAQAHAHAQTPEDAALAREDRELLQLALAEIPEAHRETLVLYYMEGQSIAAIAAALDIRESLVKQRLSRGRRALRAGIETRLESALERAHKSAALRAGVVTAIVASGARQATAATSAGKATSMWALSTTKVWIFAAAMVALVGAGGALWLATRGPAEHATTYATTAAQPTAAATMPAPDPGAQIKPAPSAPAPGAAPATTSDRISAPAPSAAKRPRLDVPPPPPRPEVVHTAPNPPAEMGQLRTLISSADGPLEGATISISPGGVTAQTSADGIVTLDLAPGQYKMTVSKDDKSQVIDVTIDANGIAIKNIFLP